MSLDAPVSDRDDAPTLHERLSQEIVDAGAGGMANVDDARIDLVAAMHELTPLQQRVCAALGEQGMTVTEAAAALGIARDTVYEAIKAIRAVFEARGLRGYLSD